MKVCEILQHLIYRILLTWVQMVERIHWSEVHPTRGAPAVWCHMTQIRQRIMISVIAWVIAGSIDGWQRLMKTLRQITFCVFPFFSSRGAAEESTQRSWCNIDGAICDVCDFKATITLSGVFKTDTCSRKEGGAHLRRAACQMRNNSAACSEEAEGRAKSAALLSSKLQRKSSSYMKQ